MADKAPIPLGRYLLFKLLKKGGMARVFLAVDPLNPEQVLAVKTLLPDLTGRKSYREMFTSEAEVGLRLQHPGIARTLDSGEDRKTPWIAMEYIFGFDLSTVQRRQRRTGQTLPIRLTVALIAEVAEALSYAHTLTDEFGQPLNIVNRDISPGNVMLAFDGHVKLIDFGIAQTTIDVKSQIGSIKGKISYMSPEQVRGLPVDHRTDIFSLGALFYELLTGVQVFRDEGDFATMEKVRHAEAPPPSTHVSAIDSTLDGIVAQALAREAYARYASADTMARDLRTWLAAHAPDQDPVAERKSFMHALFGEQIQSMEVDIEAGRSGAQAPVSPESTPQSVGRLISEDALDNLLAGETAIDPPSSDRSPAPPNYRALIAAAALVSVIGIIWFFLQ